MDHPGAMQQIRDLLLRHLDSGELIASGYASSTVYRVQRQLRRAGQLAGPIPVASPNRSVKSASERESVESENRRLRAEIEQLRRITSELGSLRAGLDVARDDARAQAMGHRVSDLEQTCRDSASDADGLQVRVASLEAQLRDAFLGCPECGGPRSSHWWCGGDRICRSACDFTW